MNQVKLEQVADPSKASPEKGEKTTAALVAVDTSDLNAESLNILNQIFYQIQCVRVSVLSRLLPFLRRQSAVPWRCSATPCQKLL